MQKTFILLSVCEVRCIFGGFYWWGQGRGGVNKLKSETKRPQFKNESKEKQSISQAPQKKPRKLRSSGGEPDRHKDDSFSLRSANSGEPSPLEDDSSDSSSKSIHYRATRAQWLKSSHESRWLQSSSQNHKVKSAFPLPWEAPELLVFERNLPS